MVRIKHTLDISPRERERERLLYTKEGGVGITYALTSLRYFMKFLEEVKHVTCYSLLKGRSKQRERERERERARILCLQGGGGIIYALPLERLEVGRI